MLKLDEKSGRFCGDFKDWFDWFFQEFIVAFRGVFSGECLKGIRWDQPHPQPLWRLEDRLIFSDNQTKKGIFVHCGNEMGQIPGVVFFKDHTPGGCERGEMLEDMGCNLSEHTWGGWGLRWVMFFLNVGNVLFFYRTWFGGLLRVQRRKLDDRENMYEIYSICAEGLVWQ